MCDSTKDLQAKNSKRSSGFMAKGEVKLAKKLVMSGTPGATGGAVCENDHLQ